jgi:P-type Ca2+ transporter type 2C
MISDSLKIEAPPIAEYPKGAAWYHMSAEEVLADLGSAATGLSTQEAGQRLAANGPNELKEGKRIRVPLYPVREPRR